MNACARFVVLAGMACFCSLPTFGQEYPVYEYSFPSEATFVADAPDDSNAGANPAEGRFRLEGEQPEPVPYSTNGAEITQEPTTPRDWKTNEEPLTNTNALPRSVPGFENEDSNPDNGNGNETSAGQEKPLDRLLSLCGLWLFLGLGLCVIAKAFGAPAPFKDGSDAVAGLLWTVTAPIGIVALRYFHFSNAWRIGGYVLSILSVASLYYFLVQPIVANLNDPKRMVGLLVGRIGAACIILPVVVLFVGLKMMTIPLARTNVIGDRDPKKRIYKWEADEIRRKSAAYSSVVSGLFGLLIWPLLFQNNRRGS